VEARFVGKTASNVGNHADWYVKKVLAVAEAYRRLAHDERVGPYV
jgi:hypothetical protein